MVRIISFSRSDIPEKKYKVVIERDGREKTIHFGASGYKDYTLFSPLEREQRKKNYITRHQSKEDWTMSGIDTAGFWAKHILWNKPSVSASLADTRRRFNL
jgi:hypothetical protein